MLLNPIVRRAMSFWVLYSPCLLLLMCTAQEMQHGAVTAGADKHHMPSGVPDCADALNRGFNAANLLHLEHIHVQPLSSD